MLKEFIERWKESRAYRKSQIVAIVFSIALTAIVSVMPFAIRSIIEDVQTATFSLTTLINLVIVFFILISRSFLSFFSRILGSRMESVIGHEKRLNILNSILKATIHRKKTMDDTIVINRLLREVYCYSDLLGTFPVNVITNIIKILFAIIVLVQINVPLFLVSFFTIPIAMFLVNITKESMKNAWENQIKQWEGMDKLAREIFASYTLVKQMKCENEISSLFNKQNKMHFKSETHINKLSILTMELNAILSSALPLLCLLIGFVLTFIGRSDIGSVIAFYMYVNYLITPFSSFASTKVDNIHSMEQEEKMREIFDSLCYESTNNLPVTFDCKQIIINNIVFKYNNGEVVTFDKHISFNNPGIYYLSAKSGFGKSTIFKLMTKTLFSNETDIVFDNNNINSIPENVFFDKVTYLDGSPTFIQGSIMDNITFFGKYDFNENHLSEIFDESENILPNRELNIGEGVALSNGQLQRINILRLFAKGTAQKLIILDEAISGVEEECEQKIIKLLKSTFNESIIILVTHRKSSEFLCDYTIDLAD